MIIMLLQLSNIINSYSVYGTVTEYNKTFELSYNDSGVVCKLHNSIWDSFSYNYRANIYDHRSIYNIETGELPNVHLPKNY